jgi:hypothetical protein
LAYPGSTNAELMAAALCITGGNFLLVTRLLTQVAHIQEINGLASVTPEIVVTARESLVIGTQ